MILSPLPTGVTAVTGVRLFAAEDRSGASESAPVALVDDEWTVDLLNVATGRWWATVDATKGAVPYSYPLLDPIDLPIDDRLVVSPEELAEEIDLPLPLTPPQRSKLRRAILRSQARVVSYLGRPLMPREYVQTKVWPGLDEWPLTAHGDDAVISVISAVQESDPIIGLLDTYTVTYLAGINVRDDEEYDPIREFILLDAMNSPTVLTLWRKVVKPVGAIKSSSTEGQSISYSEASLGGGGTAGSGAPGALPVIGTLDKWRLAGRRVYQGATHFGDRYGV